VPTSTRPVKKSDATAEALGRSRGGFSTKGYAAVDALGNPLKLSLRPGQRADIVEAEALLQPYLVAHQHEPPPHEPSRHEPSRHEPSRHEPSRHEPSRHGTAGAVIADKGFDSADFVAWIEAHEAEVVIPSRRTNTVQRRIDTNLYADRNKIERFFGRIKHYRRIAPRYEKTSRNYLAFLHVASIVTLLL